jgi:two-component system OmpR family sensor kinase
VRASRSASRAIPAALHRWRLSVHGRLALVNGLVVTLLLLALLAAQYLILAHVLVERTAALLRAQARPVIQRDLGPRPEAQLTGPLATRLAMDLGARDTAAVVLNAQDEVLARTTDANPANQPVPMPSPRAEKLALARQGNTEVTYEAQDPTAGHAIVVLVPLRAAPPHGAIIGVVQLSTRLADVDATLVNLMLFDAAALVLGIAIAAATAPVVAQAALSPLRKVTAAARAIAHGDLGQRAALHQSADEVGQLGTAFDEMADRVEGMLASQRRFIGDASHELRTPLAVLAGGLDVLEMDASADSTTRQRLVGQLRGEVTRMGKLVQELLDLASYDRGIVLDHRPVDVAAILRDVADQVRLLGPTHRIIDEAPARLLIAGDADRIRQLLLILADNAVHHTEAGQDVHLAAAREGQELVLRVSDSGAGIAAEALPHIFERFYRADKVRARAGGHAGLGLAIARGIVEAYAGTITAESAPGEGTTMTVRLPLGA